jgi:hypothetical protein
MCKWKQRMRKITISYKSMNRKPPASFTTKKRAIFHPWVVRTLKATWTERLTTPDLTTRTLAIARSPASRNWLSQIVGATWGPSWLAIRKTRFSIQGQAPDSTLGRPRPKQPPGRPLRV